MFHGIPSFRLQRSNIRAGWRLRFSWSILHTSLDGETRQLLGFATTKRWYRIVVGAPFFAQRRVGDVPWENESGV